MSFKYFYLPILFFVLTSNTVLASAKSDSIKYNGFGKLYLYKAEQTVKNVVIFISGDSGWNEEVENIALKIKDRNTLIIGIDAKKYFHFLNEEQPACLYPATDFEEMSQFVQKELQYKTYTVPLLVGYASGAALVYGLVAQAPQNTFRGAIVLGFRPDLNIKKPLCHGSGNLECIKRKDERGFDLTAVSALSVPFMVMENAGEAGNTPSVTTFFKNVSKAEVIPLHNAGVGYKNEKNWVPQFKQAYAYLLSITIEKPEPDMASLKINLPIQVLEPAQTPVNNNMLVMISGDGGWTGFDQQIAAEFAKKGIPVVGLNALKYFWNKKTPEQTTLDVLDMIGKYDAIWKKDNIILLGYSFGADVMPFIYNRLPEQVRKRVKSVALLSPSKDTDFEVHVTDLFNLGSSARGLNVPAEIEKIKDTHLVCFFGKDEQNTPVNELSKGDFKIIMLQGGHHYDNSFALIYNEVVY